MGVHKHILHYYYNYDSWPLLDFQGDSDKVKIITVYNKDLINSKGVLVAVETQVALEYTRLEMHTAHVE